MATETAEIIEGEALEVEPTPNLSIVPHPGQALISQSGDAGASDMVQVATNLAGILKDIVERQQLYAMIQGKKYPTVEAWMTIGRLDNVVALEAQPPIRHEDGSYEAFAKLIRLSDGMVVGGASALCGSPDDEPWGGSPARNGRPAKPPRPEYARRSMAATRAISRAFRGQYSWIMALAGYEPTPADEMPHDARDVTPRRDPSPPVSDQHGPDGLIGSVEKGKPPVDMETRQTPEGPAWGFKLAQGRKGFQALATGPLAEVLSMAGLEEGTRVTVWGRIESIGWEKDGKPMPPYNRIHIERVQTPEWTLPSEIVDAPNMAAGHEHWGDDEPVIEAESAPIWELTDDEKAAIAGSLPDA